MHGFRWCAALILAAGGAAQQRTVAITVDDLPYVGPAATAARSNERLLAGFRRNRVPVTGFVIEQRVEQLGAAGRDILTQWSRQGLDLANHTYSHPDMNALTIEQIEGEVVKGEASIKPLMQRAGKKLAFFRFPMNHTGNTKEKHDAIAAFLAGRGYSLATCTIDNSDYLFAAAYERMLRDGDREGAAGIRREYLTYTAAEIDYYTALNRQVIGYEPPQVMLLHDNHLNGDSIDEVLRLFIERGYRFVTLSEAQSDPAYRIPDTYITKFGPMWGYRWANVRGVKVDGRLEPEPPKSVR